MSTIHNNAGAGDIARVVLLCGDPLRARMIAGEFFSDAVKFNEIRNMLGYTGMWKGTRLSVMGSGMGCPSIGIYSHELYWKYGVDTILRVGSCGAFSEKIAMNDILLAEGSYSESSYAMTYSGYEGHTVYPSVHINRLAADCADRLGIRLICARIHTTDCFYRMDREANFKIRESFGCVAEDMESFGLFHNAAVAGKQAASLLTVSDHSITREKATAEQRQERFLEMVELALETARVREKELEMVLPSI